jgi:hypothetical protein
MRVTTSHLRVTRLQSGKKRRLGRAYARDGLAYFQRYVNVRKAKVVLGTPLLHRTFDGRTTAHSTWEYMELIGDSSYQFRCPECKAAPVVSAFELALVVGDATARSSTPNWGLPVLIDPWGGSTVGAE